jgi:hypothetical protein
MARQVITVAPPLGEEREKIARLGSHSKGGNDSRPVFDNVDH